MATSKGENKNLKGKIGNTTTYVLKTQSVTRSIGKSKKKPTKKQLPVRLKVRMITALLKPVKEFIRIGFEDAALNTKWSAYNIATSVNNRKAITGQYPRFEIDWTQVEFSQGDMPVLEDVSVQVVEGEMEFRWNPETMLSGMKDSDRVMVLAYCPEKKSAAYTVDGEKRYKGKERLDFTVYRKKVILHTYIAFIAANRKSISNTVYVGEILW